MSNPNQYFCFQFFFCCSKVLLYVHLISTYSILNFQLISILFWVNLVVLIIVLGQKDHRQRQQKRNLSVKSLVYNLQITVGKQSFTSTKHSIQLEYLSNFQLSVYKHNSILTIVIWNDRIALLWPFSSNFDPLHFAICGSENQNVFPSSISSWCHIVNNTIASSPDNSDNCSLCSRYRVSQNLRATLFFPIFVTKTHAKYKSWGCSKNFSKSIHIKLRWLG